MKPSDVVSIRRAIREPDRFVLRIKYVDSKLAITERVVSPISFDGRVMQALCLGREQVRSFTVDGIATVEIVDANKVLMPEPIREA